MDSAEAGKLLSGTAATARSPAAGSKLLPSQRPRLPSPPLPGTAASAGAAAAAGPRVAVELKVTPEQMVAVTLRVIQPAGSRLPGLRRTGFGSSLGGRLGGASAGGGAGHSVGEAAAAPPQQPGVRKPRKRVSWQRELESVRWFVKEDPAVKVGSAEARVLRLCQGTQVALTGYNSSSAHQLRCPVMCCATAGVGATILGPRANAAGS